MNEIKKKLLKELKDKPAFRELSAPMKFRVINKLATMAMAKLDSTIQIYGEAWSTDD